MEENKFFRKLKTESEFALLLCPALIIFFIGMIIPLFIGFYYSLTDWNAYSKQANFIGFQNYIQLFKENRYYGAFKFTVWFSIFNTIIQNILALTFAIILDKYILRGKIFYRTVFFMPVLLSPVLVGWVWSKLFGVALPGLNEIFGTSINFRLLDSPKTVMGGLLIANNWMWIGYWMMIYLAGLQSVPQELYEQCDIDGGREWAKFRHVTLPLIAPSITICVIGIGSGSLKVYDLIVRCTNGGPGHSSESIIMYLYRTNIEAGRSGFANAASIIYLLLLLLISIFQLKIFRRREVQL